MTVEGSGCRAGVGRLDKLDEGWSVGLSRRTAPAERGVNAVGPRCHRAFPEHLASQNSPKNHRVGSCFGRVTIMRREFART